jgi:hypothetical protein
LGIRGFPTIAAVPDLLEIGGRLITNQQMQRGCSDLVINVPDQWSDGVNDLYRDIRCPLIPIAL